MNNSAIRDWTAMLAIFAAIGVIAYWMFAIEKWFDIVGIWPASILGGVMTGIAIFQGAPRWLLLLLPILLAPVAPFLMLAYACSLGRGCV